MSSISGLTLGNVGELKGKRGLLVACVTGAAHSTSLINELRKELLLLLLRVPPPANSLSPLSLAEKLSLRKSSFTKVEFLAVGLLPSPRAEEDETTPCGVFGFTSRLGDAKLRVRSDRGTKGLLFFLGETKPRSRAGTTSFKALSLLSASRFRRETLFISTSLTASLQVRAFRRLLLLYCYCYVPLPYTSFDAKQVYSF